MKIHGKEITPETIWMCRQNIPELIVQDCIKEFNLDDERAEKLRFILLIRGVNKWFYARRKFIDLKHRIKKYLRDEIDIYNIVQDQTGKMGQTYTQRDIIKLLHNINAEMQNIAKTPRWIEWPKTITHDWNKIEKEIIIKGKRC